jgi:putative flippase GtrA
MSRQFWQYTLVGGLSFLIDTGSLFIMTEYGHLHYLLSASIAFIFGLTTNYTLCVRWIFKQHTYHSLSLEFFLFTTIGIIGLGLNQFFIWFFTEHFGCYYILSKIISTALVFCSNYYLRKTLLFQNSTEG